MPHLVLVVEDETIIALELEDQLADMGLASVTAPTEPAALSAVSGHSFDIAIVDYHIGEGTSQNVLDELAKRKVPVVLSSGSQPEELPDGHMCLTKPYTERELVTAVRSLLSREHAMG